MDPWEDIGDHGLQHCVVLIHLLPPNALDVQRIAYRSLRRARLRLLLPRPPLMEEEEEEEAL